MQLQLQLQLNFPQTLKTVTPSCSSVNRWASRGTLGFIYSNYSGIKCNGICKKISTFPRFDSTAASSFHYKMTVEEEENGTRDAAQISVRTGCLLLLKHRSYSGISTFKIPDLTDSHMK